MYNSFRETPLKSPKTPKPQNEETMLEYLKAELQHLRSQKSSLLADAQKFREERDEITTKMEKSICELEKENK